MNTPRPIKVRIPNLGLYNGTSDLEEHLRVCKAYMYVQDVDDATYYWYFPMTLKGVAQKWFSGLALGSSIMSRKERRTRIHLSKIKQVKNDLLIEFVKRFP